MLNPVIGRELTERLRGLRAFVALSIFVLLLTLAAFLVFEGSQAGQSEFDLAERTRAGRLVFETVLLVMTVLVLFFVPGVAAGAIAGERERQTLATLQVTLLRPRSIVAGKIVAALAYLVLLIVAALPVLAAAYVLGGIRITDIVRGVVAVSAVALLVATVVVAVSTFARRVQTATVLAYAVTVLLVIAGPLAAGIAAIFDARADNGLDDDVAPPAFLLTLTPIALVADAVAGVSDDGPLSGLHDGILEVKEANDGRWFALFPDTPPGNRVELDDERRRDSGAPVWLLSAVSMTALAAVSFVGAARRLRTPAAVER